MNKGARAYCASAPSCISLTTGLFIITLHCLCSTMGASLAEQRMAVGHYDDAEVGDLRRSIEKSYAEATNRKRASFQKGIGLTS